ncbi:glycosyltransferase family 4 protein [Acinetobacter sp. ULE_I001]|uniref:glycosyltransferase family 4 protein n=1 Tax=unclassified Acinetobacter TaxID=196816 RepID=UPI003AF7F9E6
MKKILFIINSLSNKSGTERVACLLANLFLKDLNCHVAIANRDTNKVNVAYNLEEEVEVFKIPGSYYEFYKELNIKVKELQPDLILIHNMGRLSLLCSILSTSKDTKIISLEHVAFDVRPAWVKFLSKILYKKINQVITLTAEDMLSYQSFHNNIKKINNISPFDVDKFSANYAKDSKTIISIGRLTYQKNFESLLETWKIVSQHNNEWCLEIYGAGEDEEKLQSFIRENDLKNVYLKGQTIDVQSVYQLAAFYVMSSRFEGLPMVLIEAQSFGLPIISYDCPHGPAEVVENNKTGFLIENQNSTKLAEAMQKLMASESLRVNFSNNARNHAKAYSQEEILKDWLRVIN